MSTQPASPIAGDAHPVQFSVDYPDRPLNRLTTLLRIFTIIPIVILVGTINGATYEAGARYGIVAAGGLLFAGPLLMILFREKYPRWWFDWNRELVRFHNRIGVYAALMEDRYPSTEEMQAVHLNLPRPYDESELNRWMPLVKWLLAIPHYIVLWVLSIGAVFAVIIAWFAILFTGHFPRGLFDYLVGVGRWYNRVLAYAALLVTDRYPPFRLSP
ncbi:MAG TPA: DUF4389 domain-containing protein [Solirubrobacteraceae bacterium]|nr:DUF4389 domain-containing protein [Solirubrobacteraceae bacterium]